MALEDAEALRVRASAENDQFERVMEESKKAHQYSLPRMRSRSDDAAACVLVTPPPRRRVGDVGDVDYKKLLQVLVVDELTRRTTGKILRSIA